MAKDILSSFGPDTPKEQAPQRSGSGQVTCRPLPYDPPKGPTTFMHEGPGLADHMNHSNCGTQGKR